MAKKVLIVSSSLRYGSNSEQMAEEALRGAKEAGAEAELISLKDKDLKFCKGCLACQKIGKCVIQDDMGQMIEKVKNAEVIIFATPVYYYGICGQMKTFLDRCNPIYGQENAFREIYLMTASADDSEEAHQKALANLNGWIECFPEAAFKGGVNGGGINDANGIKDRPDVLKQAYELGKKCAA